MEAEPTTLSHMRCQVCGLQPRFFWLIGEGFWQTVCGDRWVCILCSWWAERILAGRG